MIIGTVKEIKVGENRVGITPYGANVLVNSHHTVLIEKDAGVNSGFSSEEYKKAGATIIVSPKEVYRKADMIVKVKEPQESEFAYYRHGIILFAYLHLAGEERVTKMLIEKKVTAIAYETVELPDGSLPLLAPMSEVAGRMAVQVGNWFLQKPNGGMGKLLAGVPGVTPGNVIIFGTGVVGTNAAKMAVGIGARVVIFGRNIPRLQYLDDIFAGKLITRVSNPIAIEEEVIMADLVISGVLVTGAKAPKLITRKMLSKMKKGAVMVDVSIDQGGSFETSRPTTHKNPIYEVDGIIHYCVTNMPGAVPYTSTLALTNATIKYVMDIANKGIKKAIKDPILARGVNTINGKCTYKAVADTFKLLYTPLEKAF